MKFNKILFTLILLSYSLCYSQSNVEDLEIHYKNFEFKKVISLAESIIKTDLNKLDKDKIIKIYTLKAASHYNLSELNKSRKSFIEILKTDKNFELDDSKYSPKLIDFFSGIKVEFNNITSQSKKNIIEKPNKKIEQNIPKANFNYIPIVKSILLPGLGHLHNNESLKGWLLTSASTVNLGAMIYFIYDTNKKEEDYLNARVGKTSEPYDKYNASYKIRNILITSYVALWVFAQVDLLIFNNEDLINPNVREQISFQKVPQNTLIRISLPIDLL